MTSIDLQLTWLGVAGWLLEWRGTRIAIDPFFARPAHARPALPITREELGPLDYLLVTHAHWDHFADVPYLAVTNAAHTYVPRRALRDLRRAWRTAAPPMRRRGPAHWYGVRGGEHLDIDGLRVSFHAIGKERFDWHIASTSVRRLARAGSPGDWQRGLRFLTSHLYGECFAILVELEAELRMCFFGNLPPAAAPLAAALARPDVAVLPFCPANGDWCDESIAATRALGAPIVIVDHFDQFMPPVTVGNHVGNYRTALERAVPGTRVVVPKFFRRQSMRALCRLPDAGLAAASSGGPP